MANEVSFDEWAVPEARVVGGEEQRAIWVPITTAEGQALAEKARAENVNIRQLVANMLREWLGSAELSDSDLEQVAGGAGSPLAGLNFSALASRSQVNPAIQAKLSSGLSTAMCGW